MCGILLRFNRPLLWAGLTCALVLTGTPAQARFAPFSIRIPTACDRTIVWVQSWFSKPFDVPAKPSDMPPTLVSRPSPGELGFSDRALSIQDVVDHPVGSAAFDSVPLHFGTQPGAPLSFTGRINRFGHLEIQNMYWDVDSAEANLLLGQGSTETTLVTFPVNHRIEFQIKRLFPSGPGVMPNRISDDGMVLGQYLAIKSLKILGAINRRPIYGKLTTLRCSKIIERHTVLQLAKVLKAWRLENPGSPITPQILAKQIEVMPISRWARKFAFLTGHQISGVNVVGGSEIPIGAVANFQLEGGTRQIAERPLESLLAKFGLTRQDPVLYEFDIVFDLEPLSASAAAAPQVE